MKHLLSFLVLLYQKSKNIFLFLKSFLVIFLLLGFTITGFFTGILFYKIYKYLYNWNYFVPDSLEKIVYNSKKAISTNTSSDFEKNFKNEVIDIFNFLGTKDAKIENQYSLEKVLCDNTDVSCTQQVDKLVGEFSPPKKGALPVDTIDETKQHHFQIFNNDKYSVNYSLNNLLDFVSALLNISEVKKRAENWYKNFLLKIPSQFDLPVTFTGLLKTADEYLNKYFDEEKNPLLITNFSITDDNNEKIWNDKIFNAIKKELQSPNFFTTLTYKQNNSYNFDESLSFLVPLPKFSIGFNQKVYSVSNVVVQLLLSKYFKFSIDCNFDFLNLSYNIKKINYGVLV